MAEKKEVVVECPCCGSRLDVDVRTGKIIKTQRPGQTDADGKPLLTERDWKKVSDRVEDRMDRAGDKFEEGLQRERKRETDLDDLFSGAKEKLKRRGNPDEDFPHSLGPD